MFDACKVLSHRSFAKWEKKPCKFDGSWALGLLQLYLDDFRDFRWVIKPRSTTTYTTYLFVTVLHSIINAVSLSLWPPHWLNQPARPCPRSQMWPMPTSVVWPPGKKSLEKWQDHAGSMENGLWWERLPVLWYVYNYIMYWICMYIYLCLYTTAF